MLQKIFEKNIEPGDIVIFSMSRSRLYLPLRYEYEGKSGNGFKNKERILLLKDALRLLKEIVASQEATLIFVDDIPAICSRHDFVRINFTRNACLIDNNESIDDRKPLTRIYQSLLDKQSLYADPHEMLCSNNQCIFL